jgi:N6-adenosine-specific RNA methylase IME4
MTAQPIEFHVFSGLLPLIEGKEFDALVADIRAFGLREPIVTFDGAILDGRNRYRACLAAGVEPPFRDFDPELDGHSPLDFVISKNLKRRHLDESQRAMVAARLANLRHGGDRRLDQAANLPVGPVSQLQAATALNASERSVRDAVKVLREGAAEIIQAVDQGRLAVSAAVKAVTLPREQQQEIARRAQDGEANAVRSAIKQATRAGREAELAQRQAALPDRRYGVILADPPWRFEPWSRETGMDRAADNHYPTMTTEEIADLDIASIAADDCALFLCSTAAMDRQAHEVMRAWGFDYRGQFVWVKDRVGTGYWNRNQHELLLIGVRGDIPAPAPGTQFSSVIEAAVGEHSEKPIRFHELIEAYFPTLPKIELFARKAREGWARWGVEAPSE